MTTETQGLLWFFIIIAVIIIFPVLGSIIRKRDFKKQVTGKKPERTLKENDPALFDKNETSDYYKETLKNEAWQRTRQNFFGPK